MPSKKKNKKSAVFDPTMPYDYTSDIHRSPPRNSSMFSTGFLSTKNLRRDPTFSRQCRNARDAIVPLLSKCETLEALVKDVKQEAWDDSGLDRQRQSLYDREVDLLRAQFDFLNALVYFAQWPGASEQSLADLREMRHLVGFTFARAKSVLNPWPELSSGELKRLRADVHRNGLASALGIAQYSELGLWVPEWLTYGKDAQAIFRRGLVDEYAACRRSDGELQRDFWCPAAKNWFREADMRATHLLPLQFDQKHVGYLMGEPNDGYKHIWTIRNGLHLHHAVQRAFDRGHVVIVPYDHSCAGQRWQLRVVEMTLMPLTVYEVLVDGHMKSVMWQDLHCSELDFRDATARPDRRYLYIHYVTTLICAQGTKKLGWEHAIQDCRSGEVWGTPGKWFLESTLTQLAKYTVDNMNVETLFGDAIGSDGAAVPEEVAESMGLVLAYGSHFSMEEAMNKLHKQKPDRVYDDTW